MAIPSIALLKYSNNSLLKRGRRIVQPEGNHPVCEGDPRIGEGGFILIFRGNMDLIVLTELIQKGENCFLDMVSKT